MRHNDVFTFVFDFNLIESKVEVFFRNSLTVVGYCNQLHRYVLQHPGGALEISEGGWGGASSMPAIAKQPLYHAA